MSYLDRILISKKWRCKICMHTEPVIKGENIAANIPIMSNHVKKHRAVMTGWSDDQTKNMNWQQFIEPIDMEKPIGQ